MEDNKPTSKLTEQQKIFCREYVKTGNGQQSAIKAGYSEKTARIKASQLLTKVNIVNEITKLSGLRDKKAIMDAQEVMELYSAVARGEVKDQFGLDASLADRLKAMDAIAKRTVDIDNRIKGKGVPDSTVQIKIDWDMEDICADECPIDEDDGK